MLGTWEIIAIVAVILLLFGGAKIPELMRGLGKGVKEFKKAQKDVEDAVNEEPEAPKEEKKD
ncbi:MAG: twin-arginine translocase TatA/TatE family subunit [Paludibacteraceae bacterium]|nr:twin-arginine translocase TatA/TatE family subunit [Paludibacteraceae bacterium]